MELVDAPHSKCGTFGFVGSSPTAPTTLMETYKRFPLTLIKGKGCWVWDKDGTKFLDAVAGIATNTLGHSDKVLNRALRRQLSLIQHVSNLYQIPQQEELANWLVHNSCTQKAFFCNSGAEANEAAIKLARKYGHKNQGIQRPIILSAKNSFHGRTLAAVSATGQNKYHLGFEPMVDGFEFFEYNDYESFQNLLTDLDSNHQKVSAVIIEPLQGEGGVNPGDYKFFKLIRNLCSQRNILLIFDEVQTGIGRCGELWGYQKLGIEPDVITIAKGLGGGHPIGALLVNEKADIFEPGDHASTFGGNPFACEASLTVLKEIQRRNLLSNVQKQGEALHKGLLRLIKLYPSQLKEVRGWGLIQGLVINEDIPINSYEIVKAAIKERLLIVPAGEKVIRMVPPLTINNREINILLERLQASLEKHF